MAGQRTFSHILFDLDHTLSYYPMSTADAVAAAFGRLQLPPDSFGSLDDLASRYDTLWVELERGAVSVDGLRLAVWRSILAERAVTAIGLAERIAAEYGAVRRASGVFLFDGVRELLTDLRAAGLGLGLLTNGLSEAQWDKIHSLRLDTSFDAIAVAGDVGIYKPDPQAFARLLDRLGARPSRTLFVGDSYDMDILGAHAVGMATAWIRPDGLTPPGNVAPQFAFPKAVDIRKVVL